MKHQEISSLIWNIFDEVLRGLFKQNEICKIYSNKFFGYRKLTIEKLLKKDGVKVKDKKGNIKPDSSLRDSEKIPLDVDDYLEK